MYGIPYNAIEKVLESAQIGKLLEISVLMSSDVQVICSYVFMCMCSFVSKYLIRAFLSQRLNFSPKGARLPPNHPILVTVSVNVNNETRWFYIEKQIGH